MERLKLFQSRNRESFLFKSVLRVVWLDSSCGFQSRNRESFLFKDAVNMDIIKRKMSFNLVIESLFFQDEA